MIRPQRATIALKLVWKEGPRAPTAADDSWEGVDRGLYEHLRQVRRSLAGERGVPAYVIFGDRSLRELARVRPTDLGSMSAIHGVGSRKLADLGETFLEAIAAYERVGLAD